MAWLHRRLSILRTSLRHSSQISDVIPVPNSPRMFAQRKLPIKFLILLSSGRLRLANQGNLACDGWRLQSKRKLPYITHLNIRLLKQSDFAQLMLEQGGANHCNADRSKSRVRRRLSMLRNAHKMTTKGRPMLPWPLIIRTIPLKTNRIVWNLAPICLVKG